MIYLIVKTRTLKLGLDIDYGRVILSHNSALLILIVGRYQHRFNAKEYDPRSGTSQ